MILAILESSFSSEARRMTMMRYGELGANALVMTD
jgi:hypothetical protein